MMVLGEVGAAGAGRGATECVGRTPMRVYAIQPRPPARPATVSAATRFKARTRPDRFATAFASVRGQADNWGRGRFGRFVSRAVHPALSARSDASRLDSARLSPELSRASVSSALNKLTARRR